MWYSVYEAFNAALGPARLFNAMTGGLSRHPASPLAYTQLGHSMAAGAEVLDSVLRHRGKPEWAIGPIQIEGGLVPVAEDVIATRSFCRLIRFRAARAGTMPKILLVAPMSGHHATLLRGTVEALVAEHEVYVTDWIDARYVERSVGTFGLDSYIDYLLGFMRQLQPNLNVVAVCQPAPLVLSAVSLLAAMDDPAEPATMTLMGGPIDTSAAETVATRLAHSRPLSWFENAVVTTVPDSYPGAGRRVYPGFIQLGSFLMMNPMRHIQAHVDMFKHLVRGDGESAEAQRRFYDEYLSVMDVTADFYLETIDNIFQRNRLAEGTMRWRDQPVEPGAVRKAALMTVEGELDDISAPGQTLVAHRLCSGIAGYRKEHRLQAGVGHYGIFNGRRWREEIMPAIAQFIRTNQE
jgi:poly(3-hydroxybutyrate) depolymerase